MAEGVVMEDKPVRLAIREIEAHHHYVIPVGYTHYDVTDYSEGRFTEFPGGYAVTIANYQACVVLACACGFVEYVKAPAPSVENVREP